MVKEEEVFRRDYLFSKEDILRSLELFMGHIEHDPENGFTNGLVKNKLSLCEKFYQRIEKCSLPVLTKLYWHYVYSYTGKGMELWLCSEKDIELSEDEDSISSMTCDADKLLLCLEDEYIRPEEFATVQEVSAATVNKWLKQGKLRYAKYVNGGWLIPSTSERPNRDIGFVDYNFTENEAPMIEVFPIVAACDSVWIYQEGRDFVCNFRNYKTGFFEQMYLSSDELGRLEYAILKSGKAEVGMPIQFVPFIR